MKTKVILFLSFLLVGCYPVYKSVETGPRAKITLIPERSEMTFSFREAIDECTSKIVGRVTAERGGRDKSFYVPAWKRIHGIVVTYHPPSSIVSHSKPSYEKISFTPQQNHEYKIEYVYGGVKSGLLDKIQYNIKYLEYDENGKEGDWDVEYWPECHN